MTCASGGVDVGDGIVGAGAVDTVDAVDDGGDAADDSGAGCYLLCDYRENDVSQ